MTPSFDHQTLIFARHGNTFSDNDKVVWVGRETDIPLVSKGCEQALTLAHYLRKNNLSPDKVIAASLKRTHGYAKLITETLNCSPPLCDARLDEIDYGPCGGLTSEEIYQLGPTLKQEMQTWNDYDQWPNSAQWKTQKNDLIETLQSFIRDCLSQAYEKTLLIISSNGLLRFLPRLLLPPPHQQSYKMKTGHFGIITRNNHSYSMVCWNKKPEYN